MNFGKLMLVEWKMDTILEQLKEDGEDIHMNTSVIIHRCQNEDYQVYDKKICWQYMMELKIGNILYGRSPHTIITHHNRKDTQFAKHNWLTTHSSYDFMKTCARIKVELSQHIIWMTCT